MVHNLMRERDGPVLVVGAGPVGLLMAAELCRRDVPVILIDSHSEPMHWDRATVVHPRSLQILESIGVSDALLDVSCKQRVIKIFSDGRTLGTIDLSTSGSVYGFNAGVSEEVTESVLTDYLVSQGGAVARSSRLLGLEHAVGGMVAVIDTDGRRSRFHVRWVVGCDGVHSATRELSGFEFDGHESAKQWAVFDASVDGWSDTHEGNFAY